jgi:diguanylate cyclase (GGDEF)-like protein/PAS domain S-box-containing protein
MWAGKSFLPRSIRSQLVWAFSCLGLTMMLGFAGLLYQQQRQFLYQAAVQQSISLATTLASSSTSWVLAQDIVGLREVLQGFVGITDLKRAYILSLQGEVLSSTRTSEDRLFVVDAQSLKLLQSPPELQVLLMNAHQIDVAVPIMAGLRHVGWARVEMTLTKVKSNLYSIVIVGIVFILLAVLSIAVAATLLATRLTQRLHHLMRVATEVAQGRRDMRAQLSGDNEVGVLALAFNQMLDVLSVSERQREKINHLYAAWTESVDVIVRESDEHKLLVEVCKIIVKHVDFKLIWIGIVDADGWVRIEASSHPESVYLREIAVSVDGSLSEGNGVVGRAIREQRPIIFNHFLQEVPLQSWYGKAKDEGILAAAAFPLTRGGHCVGAIGVYSGEENYFTADLITLVGGLADDLSYALDNFDHEQQRLAIEQELRIAAAAFESQEGMFVTDTNNVILRVNQAFTKLTGYSAAEVIGHNPSLFKSGRQDTLFYTTMWQSIERERYWQGELWNRRKNGEIYPQWLCITAIANQQGQISHYVCTFTDISQRKAYEERISHLAFYDSLTKLPNRALLYERLASALKASERNKYHGALMFLDLDNFKTLNDTLGHDLGDQLLIEVGRRLQNCVRDTDTVARLGGDEFVIMLEDLNTEISVATLQVQVVAEKIRATLDQPYLLKSATKQQAVIEYSSTGSIGFALFLGHESSIEELLKRVDLAMYQAKQAGRNTIRAFIPEMQTALNTRTQLEQELHSALERNELKLYYQMQVDIAGHPVAAEVLVRWHQTERGVIFPDSFIPLAEETGLIIPIGLWILRQGCETLKKWENNPDTCALRLAVNISRRQLAQADFVAQVRCIVQETGVKPALLKLEITESMLLSNVEETISKMLAIQALGVSFSMDDFGTGYSSLFCLQKLPLEQLKIDKSFIKDMTNNKNDAAIIRTILALGENLGLNIVAEGVETIAQFEDLCAAGCLLFQGYLFGKPVMEDEFKQRVSARFMQLNV